MIGIGQFIDLGILEKLPPHLTVDPASSNFMNVAVLYNHLYARIMPGMVGSPRNDSVRLRRRRTGIPFFLKSRIIHDRIGESARGLVGKHIEMTLLIDSSRPPRRYIFG